MGILLGVSPQDVSIQPMTTTVVVEPSVNMGEVTQIMMDACVGNDVVIGDNCIINSGAIVLHDPILSGHCHIGRIGILR